MDRDSGHGIDHEIGNKQQGDGYQEPGVWNDISNERMGYAGAVKFAIEQRKYRQRQPQQPKRRS